MKYPDDYINKVICGDCLEILKDIPDQSVDLVVTDPPYGLNYNDNDLASRWEAIFGGRIERMKPNPIPCDGEEESYENLKRMLIESKRILKKGANVACCCCGGGPKPLFAKWTLLMDDIIGFKQAVVWNKMGLGMGMHYRRNYEFVLIAQKGSPSHRWNGSNSTPNVWNIPKIIPLEDQHPTVKPLELMRKIIEIHSNPNDLILDPFLGSGTTAVACKQLNRRFIGIEISEEYCKIAEKRLAQSQLRDFTESPLGALE